MFTTLLQLLLALGPYIVTSTFTAVLNFRVLYARLIISLWGIEEK